MRHLWARHVLTKRLMSKILLAHTRHEVDQKRGLLAGVYVCRDKCQSTLGCCEQRNGSGWGACSDQVKHCEEDSPCPLPFWRFPDFWSLPDSCQSPYWDHTPFFSHAPARQTLSGGSELCIPDFSSGVTTRAASFSEPHQKPGQCWQPYKSLRGFLLPLRLLRYVNI